MSNWNKDYLFTFESSHGTLKVYGSGEVSHKHSDYEEDSYLSEIVKIDMEEFDKFLLSKGNTPEQIASTQHFDILNVCYWDKSGKYVKADTDWRDTHFFKR